MRRPIYARDVGAVRVIHTGPCRLVRVLVSSTVEANTFVGIYNARASILLGNGRPDIGFVVSPTSGASGAIDIGCDMVNGISVGAATTNGGATAAGAGLDLTFIVEDC